MATAHMTEQLGRVLGGRYRLTAPIGTGASAEVYLADDVTLRRRVAVKVLHPGLAGDEAFLRRFRAEARAAAALSHPHIMAVYDWGEDDGPYLVLEFLGGGSLRAMLDQGTRLTPSQALVVGLETAKALEFAHRKGFVHRDIKPANLLFGDDGRLRIADFGLARALSEAAWTEPGDTLVGTARYAAPEQASGGRIDGKADVYALGLVLIEAVTGSVPLVGETTLATLAGRVDVPVPVPEAMGPLVPVLQRAGRPDPAERPDA
ncbi:MAG: serine/threonine protein kinase, partial [Actinomycetota bacterium]|nr:serine/threonine protein kinase [Actinomycetota bacterium]